MDEDDSLTHADPKKATNESQSRSLELLSGVSAALAAVAVLIYILGLIALGVPIYNLYTHDMSITWHAMSLAPRTTVAGLGVQRLFTVPAWVFAYITVSILLAQLLVVLLRLKGNAVNIVGWALSLVFTVLLNSIFVWWKLSSGILLSDTYFSSNGLTSIISWGALIVYALGAFTVGIELIGQVYYRSGSYLPGLHDAKKALRALAVWFGILFLAGLMQAAIAQPPLPKVEVNAARGEATTKGVLLTHVDGYWYVFGSRSHALIAIPDREVDEIRIPAQQD
jgi:hypothetical protein